MSWRRRTALVPALALSCALLAGCGSSAGLTIPAASGTDASSPAAAAEPSAADTGTPSADPSGAAGSASAGAGDRGRSMPGMSMESTTTPEINGVRAPVVSRVLLSKRRQGMAIQALAMTPAPFYLFNGRRERLIKPGRQASFDLMITLEDGHTHEPIPYASVHATITAASGGAVYSGRQLPMISAYMGPHYGSIVTLPQTGRYGLSLRIGPPLAARHLEYAHMWLRPFTLAERFSWAPARPRVDAVPSEGSGGTVQLP